MAHGENAVSNPAIYRPPMLRGVTELARTKAIKKSVRHCFELTQMTETRMNCLEYLSEFSSCPDTQSWASYKSSAISPERERGALLKR
jgi:hypothetical protein